MAVLGFAQLWEDLASPQVDWGAYALRNFIGEKRNHGGELPPLEGQVVPPGEEPQQPPQQAPSVAAFYAQKGSPWGSIEKTLEEGRNNGTMRLAASIRSATAWSVDHAISHMTDEVWPHVTAISKPDEFSYSEFTEVIRAVWRQYPSGIEEAQKKALAGPPAAAAHAVFIDAAPIGAYRLPPWEPAHELPVSTMELKDAYLVNRLVRYVLWRRFTWARGLQWMTWTGRRWESVDESVVRDAVREYFIYLHTQMLHADDADMEFLKSITGLLSQAKISAAVKLCQGHSGAHIRDAGAFDAHPDLLNTPEGIVDLRNGTVLPHNPELLLTKITRGSYRPGLTHPDWQQALTALDTEERAWFQDRIGQACTGHPPSDGIMPVLQGSGENGKTALTTDGPVVALGDYADMASSKLIASVTPGRSEHSTEMADLRGQRLLLGEELAEGRSIDVTALKRIQDVGRIKARLVHKDNMSFDATHTLFVTTNYTPDIAETDHGTWRRLALLKFRYHFRKPGESMETAFDRAGDPGLKGRIKKSPTGQHDAIVTWAVEGAMRWYARGMADAQPPGQVVEDTLAWRKSADSIWRWLEENMSVPVTLPDPADHPWCVSKDEALDSINSMLEASGKAKWSVQTFTSRLLGHQESQRAGISELRTVRLKNISRPPLGAPGAPRRTLSSQVRVLTGLVFRPTEESSDQELARLATTPNNSPRVSPRKGFTEYVATPASTSNWEPPSGYPPTPPPGTDSDQDPGDGDPAATKKSLPPETGENGKTRKNADSPPKPKIPKNRLTDEEKLERAQARKEKLAQDRVDARAAKVAELGGPLVPLPAIVLRDQTILPCTAEQAAAFLSGALDEVSVDVEHTGYPRMHEFYRLRLVQLGNEGGSVVFDPNDEVQAVVIRDVLGRAKILHAHSALADLIPLEHAQLGDKTMWDKMRDTVIAAKLSDPSLCDSDEVGLKALARKLLGEDYAVSWRCDERRKEIFAAGAWIENCEVTTAVERSGWAMIPLCEAFIRYAASDIFDCAAIARVLA
ncbi:MAG TPA: phage/plasmid primase, P4 family [Trebonia sp.]